MAMTITEYLRLVANRLNLAYSKGDTDEVVRLLQECSDTCRETAVQVTEAAAARDRDQDTPTSEPSA